MDSFDVHANLYLRKGTITDIEVNSDLEYVTSVNPEFQIRPDEDFRGGVFIRTDAQQ